MADNYPIITLCGSTKFKDEFMETQKRLTLEGNIVISVGLFGHAGDAEVWDGMDEGTLSKTKAMLDDMHKRKIDMADEIFVINVGGYIGDSTRSEIEYALTHGKTVRYLEDPDRTEKHYLFVIRDYLQKQGDVYNANVIENIEKRSRGKKYTLNEHIRGMVYSLLTNQTVWKRIVDKLENIDRVFHNYDVSFIKEHDPKDFADRLFQIKCGNISTMRQMQALKGNVETLERIEKEFGSVDAFLLGRAPEEVVDAFSKAGSQYKLDMMGEALVWEYLRNVGIDGVKPDTHIRRFLGSGRMGASFAGFIASLSDVHKQVEMLSSCTGLLKAEIDNLIWSFCADGYGEVCTANPHCDICPIIDKCGFPPRKIASYTPQMANNSL